MAKFLITGGAGFIGGNFCNIMTLKYPNDEYVCLDALTYASNYSLMKELSSRSNFKFIKGNIYNKNLVNKLFKKEKFDYVINFAAESSVDKSINDASIFVESNVLGVQVLLDACLKYGIKRFHQISTDEVYGDLSLDSDLRFDESAPLKASSPYSASKAAADLLVLSYHRTHKIPCTISRSSNNYGIYQHKEKLMPLVIDHALKNESIPVYGNGTSLRDWIYVDDNCNAIDCIIRNGKDGNIYNVGSTKEFENIYVINTLLKKLNKDESLLTYVADRKGEDRRYPINCDKLKNELNIVIEPLSDKHLDEIIEWYKKRA